MLIMCSFVCVWIFYGIRECCDINAVGKVCVCGGVVFMVPFKIHQWYFPTHFGTKFQLLLRLPLPRTQRQKSFFFPDFN